METWKLLAPLAFAIFLLITTRYIPFSKKATRKINLRRLGDRFGSLSISYIDVYNGITISITALFYYYLIHPVGLSVLVAIFGFALALFIHGFPDEKEEGAGAVVKIKTIANEILAAKSSIEQISRELEEEIKQLEDAEEMRKKLVEVIENKSEELDSIKSLTRQQLRQIRKIAAPGLGGHFVAFVLGVLASLSATLVWTIMGNPGSGEIIKRLSELF